MGGNCQCFDTLQTLSFDKVFHFLLVNFNRSLQTEFLSGSSSSSLRCHPTLFDFTVLCFQVRVLRAATAKQRTASHFATVYIMYYCYSPDCTIFEPCE